MGRAYINAGSCQPKLSEYPFSGDGNNRCRFQASGFNTYSTWLEYLESKDAVFCLQCYVFAKKSTSRPGSNALVVKGFNNCKKASDKKNSSLMGHVEKDPNSPHKSAVKCCEDLMNQSRHIDKLVEKQTSQEIGNNRLQLKASVDSVQWLAFQACAFRCHDEMPDSKNQGNFIKLIKLLATYNDDISGLVLENAPKNAKYTSPKIQKEILHIIANKVRDVIQKEIAMPNFAFLLMKLGMSKKGSK